MPTAAFDVDGTLIHALSDRIVPRYPVIQLFRTLEAMGCEMYIWSGGGEDYARMIANRLGLNATVVSKGSFTPDIAIDDFETKLGKTDLRVPLQFQGEPDIEYFYQIK